MIGLAGVGGLLATLGLTSWVAEAMSSTKVELMPAIGPPPVGAAMASHPRPVLRPRHPDVASRSSHRPAVYAAWAVAMSQRTGVPVRALEAYADATSTIDGEAPGCHLDWTTLAGVGEVESGNGGEGGGITRSGRPVSPIYGPALNGVGAVAAIADTDGGALDGDVSGDRAVGALQFLPSTWRTWGRDADADGVADPQDVDDAALSAAAYLCATGDLSTPVGWTDAVFSYNHSGDYVRSVYEATDRIATASRG